MNLSGILPRLKPLEEMDDLLLQDAFFARETDQGLWVVLCPIGNEPRILLTLEALEHRPRGFGCVYLTLDGCAYFSQR